jgi:hypothetical protein
VGVQSAAMPAVSLLTFRSKLRKRPGRHGNVNGAQRWIGHPWNAELAERTKLEKMTNARNEDKEEQVKEAAETNSGLGLSPSQVIAGGGAAAVASVIGGHLGLAGTVVGAFILSVISAIALPLFRASLEKSHAQIRRVMPGRGTDATRTVRPRPGLASGTRAPRKAPRGRKAWVAVGGTALMFIVGVGSILGFQAATGYALSSGTGALQSGVSHVVSKTNDSTSTPATRPEPTAPTVAPTVEPSRVPTDPATDPTEQPTSSAAPTPTGDPTPSPEQTAPADAGTPSTSNTPHPDETSAGVVPAK